MGQLQLGNGFVVAKSSHEMEKLKRKKEINARYSRLLLSKTIEHFQKQGHVTICLSEKLNENADDEMMKIKKLTTNFRVSEPKNRTISFWHFPSTLKCEFQMGTNSSRAMKSVRTQTDTTKKNKKITKTSTSNDKKTFVKLSNEIVSSHVSSVGNVMSVVMRAQKNSVAISARNRTVKHAIARNSSPRKRSQRFQRSHRNAMRSKNFWAAYNNFILCNRSIELRITKLFSFQNTQYIVAFSKDFFDDTDATLLKREEQIAHCYVIEFVKFNFTACIYEMGIVEHTMDTTMPIISNQKHRIIGRSLESVPSLRQRMLSDSDLISSEPNISSNENCRRRALPRRRKDIGRMTILFLCAFILSRVFSTFFSE